MSHFTHYPLFPQILTTSTLEVNDEQNNFLRDYVSKVDYTHNEFRPMLPLASKDKLEKNKSYESSESCESSWDDSLIIS